MTEEREEEKRISGLVDRWKPKTVTEIEVR